MASMDTDAGPGKAGKEKGSGNGNGPRKENGAGKVVKVDPGQMQRFPGEELDIAPGTRVLLDFLWPGKKYWAEFIGMKRGRYLLLHPPVNAKTLDNYKRDTQATIRYVHKDYHVCGFTCWVQQLIVKPVPLLFLSFPKVVEVLNMRRHDRTSSVVPVTVYHNEKECRGFIVNISRGGCRIVVKNGDGKTLPEQGEEIFSSFRLLEAEQDVYAMGLVRSVEQNGDKVSLGVQFKDLAEDVAQAIERFVASLQEYLAEA